MSKPSSVKIPVEINIYKLAMKFARNVQNFRRYEENDTFPDTDLSPTISKIEEVLLILSKSDCKVPYTVYMRNMRFATQVFLTVAGITILCAVNDITTLQGE